MSETQGWRMLHIVDISGQSVIGAQVELYHGKHFVCRLLMSDADLILAALEEGQEQHGESVIELMTDALSDDSKEIIALERQAEQLREALTEIVALHVPTGSSVMTNEGSMVVIAAAALKATAPEAEATS